MPSSPVIPRTYEEWHHCITVECGVALTADYVATRIATLQQAEAEETRRFRRLYGDAHWRAVCGWFAQAAQTLKPA